MKDFAIGGVIGITQTVLGHPLDTIKVRIQNKQNWKDLKFRNYYRGCLYPLSGSLVYNMIAFPVYERSINKTESSLLSGLISGIFVSPIVYLFEPQLNQESSIGTHGGPLKYRIAGVLSRIFHVPKFASYL